MPARRALTHRPRRRLGVAALLVAALLFVASGVAVNIALGKLRESRGLVFRTNLVLRGAAEFQTALRAAETGQRGFLLTGQPRYLEPYRRALRRIPVELAELRASVGQPAQARRLRAVGPLVDAKLVELAETVALRRIGLEPALRVVRTDRGQALTERIDAVMEAFVETERRFLAERVAAEERNARITAGASAATGLLSLLSALLGVYFIFQQRSADALARYSLELEHEVEERTRRLSDANRELDAFAYTISHDLRAPLRAMHGYSDALMEDYGDRLPDDGRGFVRSIASAAMRMNALIEDMLAYARLSRDELAVVTVSLDAVVERARADAVGTEAAIDTVAVAPPLGTVRAHPAALQAAIANLLSNALKFTAPGRPPSVRIWSERHDGTVRLWVADEGIGIAPEHQERIFAPFERLHGAETYPGTGIGLAIVRRTAERMGGRAGVASEPGRGSRFWIELAAVDVEHGEEKAA